MVTPNNSSPIVQSPIDCACVIHGDAYDWTYVDRLYNMLLRNITPGIHLHVYTEKDRAVPDYVIKHNLEPWKLSGSKTGWWYKMQMFNADHHAGPLLYFDLDVVITKNIDWLWQSSLRYFWGIHDFKRLWKPSYQGINSSIMWWDTTQFHNIWQQFNNQQLSDILKKYRGDQDYISEIIPLQRRQFFDTEKIKSWRWQCKDGGYDFKNRRYIDPNSGTKLTDILIFHGSPKPDKILDPLILQHWR